MTDMQDPIITSPVEVLKDHDLKSCDMFKSAKEGIEGFQELVELLGQQVR